MVVRGGKNNESDRDTVNFKILKVKIYPFIW